MSLEPSQSRWDSAGQPRTAAAAGGPEKAGIPPASQASTGSQSSGAAVAPARASAWPQEKRRHPRFKCEGNLEIKTDGSTIRTWATFTDISTTGCYVEMMTTFALGTKMEIQLGMNGFLVTGSAVVRATYPFLGMGIEFVELSQHAREQLDGMIASVSRLSVRRVEAPPQSGITLPPISQPGAVIEALAQFFASNHALSAEEFLRLIKESQPRST